MFNGLSLQVRASVALVMTSVISVASAQNAMFMHEKTFEQPNGYNNWNSPASVVFGYVGTGYSRDGVKDARLRVSHGEGGVVRRSNERAFRGSYSLKVPMEAEGGKGRNEFQLVSNSSEGVWRYGTAGEEHWVSFALFQGSPTKGSWELHFQVQRGGSTQPSGWGTVNNPSLALTRKDNNNYYIEYRSNGPDGLRPTHYSPPIPVAYNQWQRIVLHYKSSNYYVNPPNGFIEVWAATGNGPLVKHVDLQNIRWGYVYSNGSLEDQQMLKFGIYGAPLDTSRYVFIDELRVTRNPNATLQMMDPLQQVVPNSPTNVQITLN